MEDVPDQFLSANVHQATGMVAGQLGCEIPEALAWLKLRADATGDRLENVALDVLDRVIRLDE